MKLKSAPKIEVAPKKEQEGSQTAQLTPIQMKRLFEIGDRNKDGAITLEELKKALPALKLSLLLPEALNQPPIVGPCVTCGLG